ncbi:uncharacterized protein LOC111054637 isoform X1 [Nilaparvata lugens]|uniref:uncharacterized protein LOC111054637 isoform X1 n=1 Tax=Nilaparvata lugens TaxID=108931 RepID=UPI00193DB96E|nr:uncharacterized protein LOC111054637 isoform X1 [Nilaparvata lugens]
MTILQPCFLVSFVLFPAAVWATTDSSSSASQDSFVPREIKMVFDNCMARTSPGYCLQKKMLDFLDRALTREQIPLAEGFTLARTNDANYTDAEAEAATARHGTASIEQQIWSKLDRFFNTRSLSISLAEEGRGKKKKEYALYVVAVVTALSILVPLMLKGLALLAGKALLVAKTALMLAGLAAMRHFYHQSQHHHDTAVLSDGTHLRRVYLAADEAQAHNSAYSAYAR